ncbi:MAG TPA: hypothetical protein H9815_09620 [Candidatus Ruania gallistercoris]|uniref:RNase L inhibitor RLI-like possible metal-binding domain-containing protein n=1 Tax=Candidatus Ruania gallistercoris TaxID=2838746 RepID=A0A9D2J495_9MICO|nr:hypothetical protein [Candidatus Ruania gallistercoris]
MRVRSLRGGPVCFACDPTRCSPRECERSGCVKIIHAPVNEHAEAYRSARRTANMAARRTRRRGARGQGRSGGGDAWTRPAGHEVRTGAAMGADAARRASASPRWVAGRRGVRRRRPVPPRPARP